MPHGGQGYGKDCGMKHVVRIGILVIWAAAIGGYFWYAWPQIIGSPKAASLPLAVPASTVSLTAAPAHLLLQFA